MGSLIATLMVFAGSFGFARANLYVTNAPLQPATAAVANTTTIPSATAAPTITLTSTVRTTTGIAVTSTKSS